MNRKYFIAAILFFSYVLFSASWMAGTMSMREIMSQVGVHSLTSASTLTTALTVAKIAGTAISAYLMTRLGLRHAVTLSALLICLGFFTPLVNSYPLLVLSRFLLGLGGAFMLVYLNPVVVEWFSDRELTFVNGVNNMAFNLGIVLAMTVVPWANSFSGSWKSGPMLLSAASIFFTVLWMVVGRSGPAAKPGREDSKSTYRFRDGLADPFTWTYTFMYSGLLSFYIVLFTFYPNAGISEARTVLLAGIAGGIAGTLSSGRVRNRMMVLRVAGAVQLASAIVLSFANSHSVVLISAVVLGFSLIFPMATIFTVGQQQPGMTPARVSVRYSIFWSACYLIATVVTTVFAKIVDLSGGDYHRAFIFICVVEGSFFVGSLLLRDRGQPHASAIVQDVSRLAS